MLLIIYVMTFFGFSVKAAIFPFHGWLPAVSVAPTPVTALLHAVAVVKSGAFAVLRLTYFSFGAAYLYGTWAQNVVMAATMITIVYASACLFHGQQSFLCAVCRDNDGALWAFGSTLPYAVPCCD